MQKLPIGIQDFGKIRRENYRYVDKTPQMLRLIEYGSYLFLSRPRRFGKSLLISTLAEYFKGNRELFEGLYAEKAADWTPRAVVHFDFASVKHGGSLDVFENDMAFLLRWQAKEYGLELTAGSTSTLWKELLDELFEQTGRSVVVLIDEYDKPVTDHLTDPVLAERNRQWLRSFYETLKAQSGKIHFLLITGISKFTKMSVFSVMNNLTDVSLLPQFNDLTGFTAAEIKHHFPDYLATCAAANGMDEQALFEKIEATYNGYSWDGKRRVFNPFSLVSFFNDQVFNNYWFESGTPGFLIQLIKNRYAPLRDEPPNVSEFEAVQVGKAAFDSYDIENIDLIALLFQTGYLTITGIEGTGAESLYSLFYPNQEVRTSMSGYVLEAFMQQNFGAEIQPKAILLKKALREENSKKALQIIHALFAGIPYTLREQANEAYYHSLFCITLNLLGIRLDPERLTDKGRVDGVLHLDDKVFIIELKYARKGTMKSLLSNAGEQIALRRYYEPFLADGKKVLLWNVGFLDKKNKEGKRELMVNGDLTSFPFDSQSLAKKP